MKKAKELLEQIVATLIEDKDSLKIEETADEMGVLLSIDVPKQERGKIIGKRGEMIKSIRYIIKSVGFNENSRVSVVINEPDRNINDYRDTKRDFNPSIH
jgi:predicted RNA-binding protein YlqC (UPF0109 family)